MWFIIILFKFKSQRLHKEKRGELEKKMFRAVKFEQNTCEQLLKHMGT